MYRLTVHLTNQKKVTRDDKQVLFNTISHRNLKNENEVEKKLNEIREKYTIARGKDYRKKDKYKKELIYIRHEK
jgi:hypothetical protein